MKSILFFLFFGIVYADTIDLQVGYPNIEFTRGNSMAIITQKYSANGNGTLTAYLLIKKGKHILKHKGQLVAFSKTIPIYLSSRVSTKTVTFRLNLKEYIWPNIPHGKVFLRAYIVWRHNKKWLKNKMAYREFWVIKPRR